MPHIRYEGQTSYEITVCGLKRKLPVIQIAPDLWIASFVMLGDAQLVNVCAGGLATKLAQYDFELMVGPEAKVVPLLQSLATLLGHRRYVVCRKSVKAYMQDPIVVEVRSITTKGVQTLVLDGPDVARVRGKRVAVVDDVVSTGGSIEAVDTLLRKAGAEIVCKAAVLKEGDEYQGDLIYLGTLPVFSASGSCKA
ncbi:MAG TPA: adenine phosphoribosyltransferase [Firmicutes bacterium]|nr:adenine phosphoribosyltransferase [Bacillota bacterium]